MHCLTIFVLCLVASFAIVNAKSTVECGPVCAIYCQYGNVLDKDGCPTCSCKKTPCQNDQEPLEGYFCGLSSSQQDCPSTHYCDVAPNDAYAVCCPNPQ